MGYGTPSRIGALTAAGSINTDFALGRVTHLLCAMAAAPVAADLISVTLSGPDQKDEVLINNVSLLALSQISDFRGGFSSTLQTAISSMTGTDYVGFFFAIPVGNINLKSTRSKLDIQLTLSQATTLFLSAVAMEPDGQDYLICTRNRAVLNASVEKCEAVFVYYATGTDTPITDAALNDVQIVVETDAEGASTCNLQDCIAMTAALGELESNAPRNVVCVFQNVDEVPDTVSVQLSGTDADTDLSLIVQTREMPETRLLKAMEATVEKTAIKMSKFTPSQQSALQIAGVAAPAAVLRENAKQIRAQRRKLEVNRGA